MPIVERTGAEFYPEYERHRVDPDEAAEKWLSHEYLEYGDYLSSSSDIQASNVRVLHEVLEIERDSPFIHIQEGGYGYRRAWVRIDDSPPEWEMPTGPPNERTREFDEPAHLRAWEEHVREQLKRLDNYPLFDEEDQSELMEEWAEDAWDDYGRSDLMRHVRKWCDDFCTWAETGGEDMGSLFEWGSICSELPDVYSSQLHHAEGGEGGVYFDIDSIAVLFVAHHLPSYADAVERGDYAWADGPNIDPPEDVLAGMLSAIAKDKYRRGMAATAWHTILSAVVDQSWPDWRSRPDELRNVVRMAPTDSNLLIIADMIEERSPTRGGRWPAILRAYAALPDATPDPQPADGAVQ